MLTALGACRMYSCAFCTSVLQFQPDIPAEPASLVAWRAWAALGSSGTYGRLCTHASHVPNELTYHNLNPPLPRWAPAGPGWGSLGGYERPHCSKRRSNISDISERGGWECNMNDADRGGGFRFPFLGGRAIRKKWREGKGRGGLR